MSTILVSRHSGALDWFKAQNIIVEETLAHLEIDDVKKGDIVVGNLPIQLAARVCAKGARYFHLEINVPLAYRGKELSASLLEQFKAKLTEFDIVNIDSDLNQV